MPFDALPTESATTEVLRKLKDHLSSKRNWCRGNNNSWGRVCAVGGVNLFADYYTDKALNNRVVALLDAATDVDNASQELWTPRNRVKTYNDGLSDHRQLMWWLDRALKLSIERDKCKPL